MPRRGRLFKRHESDDYNSGDSLDDDSAAALDSAAGPGSVGGYGSEGIHSGSEGVNSDPTGNKRRFRLRGRFGKSKSVDDVELLNAPRQVNLGRGRARASSHDSSYRNEPASHNPSKLKKLRQRLNPFSKGNSNKSSDNDLDSLGLGSADEGAVRRFRRGEDVRASPSAMRNWRKKGGKGVGGNSDTNGDGPPIRNVSFDTNDSGAPPAAPTENMRDMLSYAQSSMTNVTAPRPRSEGKRARYSVYHGNKTVKKKFRVRPYHVFPEARYLTEEDIYADSTAPSVFYEFLKSYIHPTTKPSKKIQVPEQVRELFGTPAYDGRIGSLRVEVLGCVSLDRQKPDISVYLVSGDAAFCTDVIQGYRSPMWPCESRRAAVFPLHHAYTQLFVGVFDSRVRKNKENDVFCGRVSIDVATLRPDTEYDITFPLRASTLVYDRKKRGVIRLRFSLHWFNERAAVLSYFKGPKAMLKTNPLLGGYPTIPCADPKTFRNVAYTVYGADLPGKYSRTAFRSTVREFNLYHVNFRFLVKTLTLDAIFYEKPYISLYLFIGGLCLVWMEAVRLVPPFWLLYAMIQYLENYYHFVVQSSYNEGYRQLTALEVLYGLVFNSMQNKEGNFKSIEIAKRAKKRGPRSGPSRALRRFESLDAEDEQADDDDIAMEDHKEFPFSHRYGYPKFGVEDSLAPSKTGGGNQRLHGRLSVYYASPAVDETADQNNGDDESSYDSGDDETVITTTGMGDTMFDMDNLEDEDEEEVLDGQTHGSAYGYGEQGRRAKSRVHLGTPQNNDVAGRKVPPQVSLKKIEHLFHKLSWKVAYELVAAPPTQSVDGAGASAHAKEKENKDYKDLDESEKKAAAALKRRYPLDEFDKLLALEFKSANPVNRILASFLGPLMRMGRTVIYVIRIAFNATTWRDPFLSFWIFVALLAIFLLLLVFPWKIFFFLATVILVGPQNILLRRYLEKQAEKREKEKQEAAMAERENMSHDGSNYYGASGSNMSTGSGDSNQKRNVFGLASGVAGMATGMASGAVGAVGTLGSLVPRKARRGGKRPSIDNSEAMVGERPPFSSDLHGQSSSKKLPPRSIAVPYSRVRKERFYDWPPDPTVSRATPIYLFGPPPSDNAGLHRDDDSLEPFEELEDDPLDPIEPVAHSAQAAEPAEPMEYDMSGDTNPYYAGASQNFEAVIPGAMEAQQQLRHRKFVQNADKHDQEYMAEYDAMGYG